MIRPKDSHVQPHRVREVSDPGDPALWVHPEWEVRFPWLVQGTTGGNPGDGVVGRDFALFPNSPAGGGKESWERLGIRLGFGRVVHSRQLHGSELLVHGNEATGGDDGTGRSFDRTPGRLVLGRDADGHLTARRGILLGVTVADCVPVFLLDPDRHAVALLHAGWRGTAARILERGVAAMAVAFGSRPADLCLHLGPAICGGCYEVGPEVHRALGRPDPGGPSLLDLREHLTHRAMAAGLEGSGVTVSTWCTRCGGSPFFSHRGGDGERQVAFMGIGGSDDAPPTTGRPSW